MSRTPASPLPGASAPPPPRAHIKAVASQGGPLRMSFQKLRLRADEDCSRRGHATFYYTNWVLLQLQRVD